jgi:hypothetical protein
MKKNYFGICCKDVCGDPCPRWAGITGTIYGVVGEGMMGDNPCEGVPLGAEVEWISLDDGWRMPPEGRTFQWVNQNQGFAFARSSFVLSWNLFLVVYNDNKNKNNFFYNFLNQRNL